MIIKVNDVEIDLRLDNEITIPGIGTCLDITHDFMKMMEGETDGDKTDPDPWTREACGRARRWLSGNRA